jgi:2-polyprenyl-6-methoxyphenol hydroxylase-like FAD-dependent oxidoreductase
VSLFWSVPLADVAAFRSAGLTAWKREVLALEPRAEGVLAQIESADQLLAASYFDVTMSRFHEPGIVFIGDAAHATSPQLGQGCNLALEDARVLAECLRDGDLAHGLDRYSATRRRHVGYYQWASRTLTPLFQSESSVLGFVRDAFMGLFSRSVIAKRLMLRTLAGVQQGLLGPALPITPVCPQLPPRAPGDA